MTPDDAPDDPLDALVDAWQEAFATGRDVPPAELAAARPDLLPALEEKVRRLRKVAALAAVVPDDTERTTARSASYGPPVMILPPSLEGTDLGGYRVLDRLGAGGMGEVYRAEDVKLGRQVAVKVMRATRSADPAADDVARARFVREARAAAALRDDHVCPIFHVGEADGRPFLVMPLLAGESLADRLKRGPLPPAEVARVGREAAQGLAAAHARGLIHRDVKPANLWLEAPTGRVLVLDFGLARSADPADGVTTQGGVVGTPAYMAPEQVDGLPLDARADLFALGAVLYECATGRAAFAGPTLTAILKAVATHTPEPPAATSAAVPLPLSNLVMRLLAKAVADRPPSAAAVVNELTSPERPPPAETTEYRPPRRRWRPVAAAGCVLLIAVAVGAWALTRPQTVTTETPATPPAPTPAPAAVEPLRVVGLKVHHIERTGPETAVARGPLGESGTVPKLGDSVTVEARLNRPAFAYLVGFGPDGVVHRLSDDRPTRKADVVRYPPDTEGEKDAVWYGLTDGLGLYVFAVVASDEPLPPFADLSGSRWEPVSAKAGEGFLYDGAWVDPLVLAPGIVPVGKRGPGERVVGAAAGVVRAASGLRRGVSGGRVMALGFGVGER